MKIGFSTGSLKKGDFKSAIDDLNKSSANVVELSALRESELDALINSLDRLDLRQFEYVSFHAPSSREIHSERELVNRLLEVKEKRNLNIIVHPDIIIDTNIWKELGAFLCIENMDNRKPIGRTCRDLTEIFFKLP